MRHVPFIYIQLTFISSNKNASLIILVPISILVLFNYNNPDGHLYF